MMIRKNKLCPRKYLCRTPLQLGLVLSTIASTNHQILATLAFTPSPSLLGGSFSSSHCFGRSLFSGRRWGKHNAIHVEREEAVASRSNPFRGEEGASHKADDLSSPSAPRRRRRRPSASAMAYFETRFQELLEFRELHGHTRVPRRQGRLGDWVNKLRQRKEALDDERLARLNKIGFCWNASDDRRKKEIDQWWKQLESIRRTTMAAEKRQTTELENNSYTCSFDNSDLSLSHSLPRNKQHQIKVSLSFDTLSGSQKAWLMRQRIEYIESDRRPSQRLGKDQIQALDELDRNWWKTARERKWDVQYAALKQFKIKYGHCNVTSAHSDKKLVNWVQNTRKKYKAMKLDCGDGSQQLSRRQIELLDRIGLNWDPWGHYTEFTE